MLNKDLHCLEAILEAIDRIFEYTAGLKTADELNNDHRNFDTTMINFVVIREMVDKLSDGFKKIITISSGRKLKDSEILLQKPEGLTTFSRSL